MLSNREQICYEIALMLTHDQVGKYEDILKGMALAHNLPLDDVILVMEELQQYTEQMKNESQDNLDLFESQRNHGKK